MRRVVTLLLGVALVFAVVALTAWALEVRVPARSTARAVIPTNENGIPIFGATPGKVEVTSMPASPSPQVVTLLDNVTVTADAPATFGPVVVDGFREIVFFGVSQSYLASAYFAYALEPTTYSATTVVKALGGTCYLSSTATFCIDVGGIRSQP